MNLRRLSPRAEREVLDAVEWISRDNPAAAQAFLDGIGEAVDRIERYPQIGVARPDLAPPSYRFLVLTEYRYIIVYRIGTGGPNIVRVVHAARDLRAALRELR